jgi:transcriptional regulator GlxA family with amidase domain
MRPIPITIVIPPQAQLLDVSGLLDVFLEANRRCGSKRGYELSLVSTSPDKVARAAGMSLIADISIFDEDRDIDPLLVAGRPNFVPPHERTDLHAWLRRRVPLARRCASVGTGAFFLGAAGLLDAMNATTHWYCTAELAQRCPAARILPNRGE